MSKGSVKFLGIRGTQAQTEYYVCMVPISYLPKLFIFSDSELPASVRAQRILNKARIPEMKRYILDNPTGYVFSALTASVDGEIKFTPIDSQNNHQSIGEIEFDLKTRILINDGQHRKAAIEAALKENPALRHEDIAVVLFADCGLKRSQQMFSDLNRYAVRPTRSLNILYDQRDPFSVMIRKIVDELPMFGDWVDREQATISNRAKALYTLSGIHGSSLILLKGFQSISIDEQERLLRYFWSIIYRATKGWQDVVHGIKKSSALRQESLCAHAVMHKAAATVGNALLHDGKDLDLLLTMTAIDWDKVADIWNGHVVVNNRVTASAGCVQYIAGVIKKAITEGEYHGA